MMGLLLAYGTLIPQDRLSVEREGKVADAVHQRLYDLAADRFS